ncbi:MAG: 23S rRNA (uracil(1939)-C(5))-methyltransferase RlmD [Candidatus Sumerlaeia bacterium]
MTNDSRYLDLTIDSLSYGGRGVGRHNGLVVFVEGAAPGDRLRVRIVNRKKTYLEGTAVEILEPSPHRVEPPPGEPSAFGGCTWHFIAYEEQLRQKRRIVADALERIAGAGEVDVQPTRPSPDLWRYRNKIEMTFGSDPDGRVVLGFHQPGSFDRVYDVPVCLLAPETFDRLTAVLRAWANRHGLPAYDPRSHEGLLRHAILRRAAATGETLLILLTNAADTLPGLDELLDALRAACPELVSFTWGVNSGRADFARVERVAWQWGDGYLMERLGGLRFRVSGTSFFQTNSRGAEVLYDEIREQAELTGRETLLDAYCGTGAIGLFLAGGCGRVVGIDEHQLSIWDARANARLNGFDHCTFLAGPMRRTLDLLGAAAPGGADRLVVDPPRGGMDKASLRQLLALKVPVFLYVSCNPTTMSRDVQAILEAGYRLERVQPVDLFPHTYHVETVAKFRK